MKKIIVLLMAVMCAMNIEAQHITVMKTTDDGVSWSYVQTYKNTSTEKFKVIFGEDHPNLLPNNFSVSASKKVQFTKSNLYWDGEAYHFEAEQTDYPSTWDTSHVGLFYWTNITDYKTGDQLGAPPYMPYDKYVFANYTTTDKFWCGEDNKLNVDGLDGLYAMTKAEWIYLLSSRNNAENLYKNNVTVTNGGINHFGCLIIAPDNFTGTLQSSYTLGEINTLGLVCLPCAGQRQEDTLIAVNEWGTYWTATPDEVNEGYAYSLEIYTSGNNWSVNQISSRISYGMSIRLIRNIE